MNSLIMSGGSKHKSNECLTSKWSVPEKEGTTCKMGSRTKKKKKHENKLNFEAISFVNFIFHCCERVFERKKQMSKWFCLVYSFVFFHSFFFRVNFAIAFKRILNVNSFMQYASFVSWIQCTKHIVLYSSSLDRRHRHRRRRMHSKCYWYIRMIWIQNIYLNIHNI